MASLSSLIPSTFRVLRAAELAEHVKPITEDVITEMEHDAEQRTPVGKTGQLRAGWRIRFVTDTRWVLTNDVPYGRFVEFGTRYVRPKPMLGEAAAQARAKYV